MRHVVVPALIAAAIALVPVDARADRPWINLGASEILLLPDVEHYAVYGYVAVTLPINVEWQELYVIPGLGFEIAPEVERGGFTGYLTLERALSPRVAGDLLLVVVHDQERLDGDSAVFSFGVGLGVSIALGELSLSPSISAYRPFDASDWSLAPTMNVSHSL
jgi:hypothetical protein